MWIRGKNTSVTTIPLNLVTDRWEMVNDVRLVVCRNTSCVCVCVYCCDTTQLCSELPQKQARDATVATEIPSMSSSVSLDGAILQFMWGWRWIRSTCWIFSLFNSLERPKNVVQASHQAAFSLTSRSTLCYRMNVHPVGFHQIVPAR